MSQADHSYPLMDGTAGTLHAGSGRPVEQVTLDALCAGELEAADLRISAEALRAQAAIAASAGFPQLAANLRRAAELTALPNEELLRTYEALRPGRSTYAEMSGIADRLAQTYAAHETAAFVHEAAEVYRQRGLVKAG